MAAESFWSAVSSLTTTPISFLYILVLTDRWRYPPRRRRILLAALLTAAMVLQCLCFLLMEDTMAAKYAANFVSVVFCPLALLLASPWRHGRVLFILATGACLSNVCTMLLSFFGLPYSPERVALKLLLNGRGPAAVLFPVPAPFFRCAPDPGGIVVLAEPPAGGLLHLLRHHAPPSV